MNIFGNLGKFYDIFAKGKVLVNAVRTKNQALFVNSLGAVLVILAGLWRAHGHNFPLTDGDLVQLAGTAGVIFGVYNNGAILASTDKIGLPPRKQPDADSDPVSDATVSTVPEPEPQATMQLDPKATVRIGGELVDPLAGIDTTYIN